MPERYSRTPNVNCKICGKKVYKRPVEIKRNRGNVFCSRNCYGISTRKEKPCVVCGKLILSGLNKKTCSRSCANKHRTGIKYKIGRPKDKVVHYKSLKLRLLKNKGNKCERCDYSRFEILQIHHKDHNHSNNEFENLELVCPNCHAEEHFLENSWLKDKEIPKRIKRMPKINGGWAGR